MTDADHGRDVAHTTRTESLSNTRLATLTAFERDVLWTLSHGAPMRRTAIWHAIAEYYGEPFAHGRIDRILTELAERGLVDADECARRPNEYRLTTAGRRALSLRQAWIQRADGRGQ